MGKFLDYKMIGTKLVVSEMEELQIIISDLRNEGSDNNKPFQSYCCDWEVASFLEGLQMLSQAQAKGVIHG